MRQEKNEEEDSPALRIAYIQRLGDYIKKSLERFITAANNIIGNISTDKKQ